MILDTAGKALELALNEGVYLIKPNLREFCSLTGASPEDWNDIQTKAKALIRSKFCQVVVVSVGAKGALLISERLSEHIAAPAVVKKSTIGAGDSMMAGIVHQLSLGCDLRNAAAYGVASGAAATIQAGSALCTKHDTDLLFAQVKRLQSSAKK